MGPYDLSSDLNCPAEWGNEKYILQINKVCDILSKEKLGIFLPTVNQILDSKDASKTYSLIVSGMDTDFLKTGIGESFK